MDAAMDTGEAATVDRKQEMGCKWSRGGYGLLVMLCCFNALCAAASAAANEHDAGVLTTVTLSGYTTPEVLTTTEFGK